MEYTLGSTSTSSDLWIKVQVSDDFFLQVPSQAIRQIGHMVRILNSAQ